MNNTWVTKTGKEIKITKMTDSHLLNTILMLQRNAWDILEYAINHGYHEGCLSREFLWKETVFPVLVAEAKKRGIIQVYENKDLLK